MGRDGTSAREISFVSLVAYGPNSDSTFTMGGYSFWNQAGQFPTAKDPSSEILFDFSAPFVIKSNMYDYILLIISKSFEYKNYSYIYWTLK